MGSIIEELRCYYQKLKGEYVLGNLKLVSSPLEKFNITNEVYEELARQSYDEFFDKHQSELGHYFRTIYNIIKFVNDNKPENPKYYTGLVRAQFSTYEHLLLFYNCFSEYGEEKFQPLVIEYSLLDNMPTSRLLDEEHESFYPDKAYE